MKISGSHDEDCGRRRASGAVPTIMVVEDCDDVRFMSKLSLELSGYYVVEAVDGQQALEMARREPPDAILMKLNLPMLDGFAVTRSIRQEEALNKVPIVAVTAYATADYRARAYVAGCNEYVTMPIDFDRLAKLFDRLLSPLKPYPA